MSAHIAKASAMSPRARTLACACLLLAPMFAPPALAQSPSTPTPSTSSASSEVFSSAELDQMFASVALYPDPLLAQVLMAATYPGDVADAAKWSKAHPDAKGETAVSQVASQPWDPSVQALVAFPQVLASLGQDAAWVQRMGDAFLAQPDRVMDSVQRLRRQAEQAGNLQSNEYQRISKEDSSNPASADPTIIIESSNPDVVYVPSYDPNVMYGSYGWGGYPPYYYPPGAYWYPGAALAGGIMLGVAIGIAGGLWGDVNWGSGDIDIDVNNNFNREVNRGDRGERGDRGTAVRAASGSTTAPTVTARPIATAPAANSMASNSATPANRNGFRGDDAQRAQARDQARQSMDRRGVDSPARDNRQAQDRARQANATGRAPGSEGFQQRGSNNTRRPQQRTPSRRSTGRGRATTRSPAPAIRARRDRHRSAATPVGPCRDRAAARAGRIALREPGRDAGWWWRTPSMNANRHDHAVADCCSLLSVVIALAFAAPAIAQQAYPTPDAAAEALVQALGTGRADTAKLDTVLGPKWQDAVPSDVDRADVDAFLVRYRELHRFQPGAEGHNILVVGRDAWSFPVPLARGPTAGDSTCPRAGAKCTLVASAATNSTCSRRCAPITTRRWNTPAWTATAMACSSTRRSSSVPTAGTMACTGPTTTATRSARSARCSATRRRARTGSATTTAS